MVIVPATGVKASYYGRYATYVAESGFRAVTFDYRGIGASKEPFAVANRARWHEWASLDIDAVLAWVFGRWPNDRLFTVGHSFGGFGVGLAEHGRLVERHVSVGAQHAYWRDYRAGHRVGFWWRWHLLMPALVAVRGHFPGRRLGWLEDLPRGVAFDWARSHRDFTASARDDAERRVLQQNLDRFTAPTLSVSTIDDPYATPPAVDRGLSYSPQVASHRWEISPADLGVDEIGHFGLFHARFRDSFWPATVDWLRNEA